MLQRLTMYFRKLQFYEIDTVATKWNKLQYIGNTLESVVIDVTIKTCPFPTCFVIKAIHYVFT